MKTSSTAVTRKKRSPAKQSRPDPRGLFHRDSIFEKDDAHFAVFCLNACIATAAHQRLLALHHDLAEFRAKSIERKLVRAALDDELRGRAGPQTNKCRELAFQHSRLLGSLDRLHRQITARLARYRFRPGIAYTAVGGELRSGVVSVPNPKVFRITTGNFPITEGDAALALVRLHATGDLAKVRLCENCRKRWLVAAHSNYRFCSKECCEQFLKNQPDYHTRKARNQRNYRERLKLAHAAGANLK